MKTLLQQLQDDLNKCFAKYEDSKDIPLVQNAECIAWLKTAIGEATCAFVLIKTLPDEINKLDTKFWSFLPFVDDSVRDLKENLQKILNLKKYMEKSVLQVESIELRSENAELNKRIAALEKTVDGQKLSALKPPSIFAGINTDQIPEEDLAAQIRAEVEQEVKAEVEELRKQNHRLQEEGKRLTLKCDAFKKQTASAVVAKEQVEQQLANTQHELSTTKDSLRNAQAEIMRLAEENRMLRQRLNPEKNKSCKVTANSIELQEKPGTGFTKPQQLVY